MRTRFGRAPRFSRNEARDVAGLAGGSPLKRPAAIAVRARLAGVAFFALALAAGFLAAPVFGAAFLAAALGGDFFFFFSGMIVFTQTALARSCRASSRLVRPSAANAAPRRSRGPR